MTGNLLLSFSCPNCEAQELNFSFLDIDQVLLCKCCAETYVFDSAIQDEIRKFVALNQEIQRSASILGTAVISVSVKDNVVEVPFQLLFSRFPVVLNLRIGNKKIALKFIFDALKTEVLHQQLISR